MLIKQGPQSQPRMILASKMRNEHTYTWSQDTPQGLTARTKVSPTVSPYSTDVCAGWLTYRTRHTVAKDVVDDRARRARR